MNYARIQEGKVIEIIPVEDGLNLKDMFHPDIVETLVECNAEIQLGWTYDKNKFSAPALLPVTVDLASVKRSIKLQIDRAAETERLNFITGGAGQAMTYQQKTDEAGRLASDSNPQAANYPLLAAEIGITAATLKDVAAVVTANYRAWQHIGAAIEGIRLGAKKAIDSADDQASVNAVLAAIAWPSATL